MPKKFSNDKIATLLNKKISLDSLDTNNECDKVTVSAKVLQVDQPIQVSANFTKQDVIIADATASAKIGKITLTWLIKVNPMNLRM